MQSKTILLCCTLLAILIVHLPCGGAVTCAVDPDNEDCVDCTDPLNAEDAECIDEEEEETTTITPTTVAPTSSTTRRTRPTRRGGRPGWGRPGWGRPGRGRPGWRRRRTTTVRPRTILGNILQKKIDFLNGIRARPKILG
ncbi:hypothetical protein KR044_002545 [Drosophila immigrans]|nr:hypothetical protein KR044_002545 [Drosophila immigrans]